MASALLAAVGHLLRKHELLAHRDIECSLQRLIVLKEDLGGARDVGENRLHTVMQQSFHRIAQTHVFHDPADKDAVLCDGVELAAVSSEPAYVDSECAIAPISYVGLLK